MIFLPPLFLVPCGPTDLRASVSCATGELTVTWNNSVPASNYTTVITRDIGQPLQCNSTETQCTTSGLLCGTSYAVTVFSVTGTCISLPSTAVAVQTCEKHRFIIPKDKGATGTVSNFLTFISLQCRVLPPTSQQCTTVLLILYLCHGWPVMVPNTTMLSL